MPPESRDPAHLWDMLDAARLVRDMTRDTSYEQYMANCMLQLAVERLIEIIDEAAPGRLFRVSASPFEYSVAADHCQRHVLAHEYGEIRQDRIWRVVTVHVPELIAALEPLVPATPNG